MLLQKKDDKNIFIVPARSKAYKRTHTHTHTHTHTNGPKKSKLCCFTEQGLYLIAQWQDLNRLCWQYCSFC